MSSMNFHEILYVNKSRWILLKCINPHHYSIIIFKIISFFYEKFYIKFKKFWRQKFLKMGIGDYSQKLGSGISLGIGLIKEGSHNPQLHLIFFNLKFFKIFKFFKFE